MVSSYKVIELYSYSAVAMVCQTPPRPYQPERASLIEERNLSYGDGLNFRQLKALKSVPKDEGWSVSSYKQLFKISTMTAFRDLTDLHDKGHVVRLGRGRACRYLLKKEI